MRVSILGVGAIGSVVAANLASTSAEVHLHVRGERGALQMVEGLRVEGHQRLDVDASRFLFSCEELPIEAPLHQASDVVVLACKSYAVADLAQRALEFVKPDGVVFALSNGLGHVETLVRIIGPSQVLAASTTHGAYSTPEGLTVWAGHGGVDLASPLLALQLNVLLRLLSSSTKAPSMHHCNPMLLPWFGTRSCSIWPSILLPLLPVSRTVNCSTLGCLQPA